MLSAQNSQQLQFQQYLYQQPYQQPPFDLDLDDDPASLSLSSSPNSAQLSPVVFASAQTPPPSASFVDHDLLDDDYSFSMLGSSSASSTDPNMAGPWVQQQPPQTQAHLLSRPFRMAHHRDSSLSSLGSASAGPASPFSQNTSNPHIAVTDPAGDGGMAFYDDPNYQLSKPMGAASAANNGGHDFYQSTHQFGGLLAPTRKAPLGSQPVSVASSIASNSPVTPSLDQADDEARRRNGEILLGGGGGCDVFLFDSADDQYSLFDAGPAAFPKFDPYHNDDLAAAGPFGVPSPAPQDMFTQRLQAVNSQHLRSSALANAAREHSPFRASPQLEFRFQQQQQQQAQVQAQAQAQAQAQHSQVPQQQPPRLAPSTATPQTISPKDAVLEYHDVDADPDSFSLFAQSNNTPNSSYVDSPMASKPAFNGMTPGFGYLPMGPQYGYSGAPPPATTAAPAQAAPLTTTPAPPPVQPRVLTTEVPMTRPFHVAADGGTYTCTYHGCTQRFETPALLQKHKREGHRQANALGGGRRGPTSSSSAEALHNTQAGPHRCERINPSTGKPCNTVFSRPYDLTRHEDTIHNARKQKVRCALCTEEKTFSRADALTRHFRVCHPDVELRGKQRKRVTNTV